MSNSGVGEALPKAAEEEALSRASKSAEEGKNEASSSIASKATEEEKEALSRAAKLSKKGKEKASLGASKAAAEEEQEALSRPAKWAKKGKEEAASGASIAVPAAAEEEDALSRAEKAAEDLYHLRDTYFPTEPDDKTSKLQQESDRIIELLDSIPLEQIQSPMELATLEYLRGKALDVFPDYNKDAETHLMRAVKLNHSLVEAWLSLGNCLWKKGELTDARKCLNVALIKMNSGEEALPKVANAAEEEQEALSRAAELAEASLRASIEAEEEQEALSRAVKSAEEGKEEALSGASKAAEGEQEDTLSRATKVAENLYLLKDTYFPPKPEDRMSKLQQESDLILKLLDSIPPEQRKSQLQRATFEYLRGKALDVFADYNKDAEDHLSKAVKLNPSLADAWLCLGNCIWKKGDLAAAKNCLNFALMKGPNKYILCQLSMLKRKISQGAENQTELIDESIKHAKDAIALDVKDGYSWYNLGNGYLTSYFATGSWDHTKLSQSLKAYQNAEKDAKMHSNPDLYFNSAVVNQYLENYERALTGFEAAALKDPGLEAEEEVRKIVDLLDKVDNLLRGRHERVTAKRVASLASSFAALNLRPSYVTVTIDLLSEGLNRALAIEGKVLFFVKNESQSALYYLLCGSNKACFVLSVYGVRDDVIKEGDQLTLLNPYFRDVDFSWKEKHYQFKSVRVDFYEQVLVNGRALTFAQSVQTTICAQHQP